MPSQCREASASRPDRLSRKKGRALVPITLRELAELVGGQLHGDGGLVIQAARPFTEAGPDDITFVEAARHAARLKTCRAGAVVAGPDVAINGLAAFVTIVRRLHGRPEAPPGGVDPRAAVHPTARLGEACTLDPFAVVGENSVLGARCHLHSGAVVGRHCRLGDDVVLYPNAVLYEGTVVGNRVILHAGSVMGADGFGYRFQDGRQVKVPQLGHVEIGDDVEIGACTTIDRGTFAATRIGEGTKIDNLVQIGHNCHIGRHNLLVGQMGIAGSSSTGDYVVIAGQVGIRDHVHIGDRAIVGAQAGVIKDVPAGQVYVGAPARPERESKRMIMCLEKLPEMRRDVRRIKQQLGIKDEE
jgi:UDP-3-O-[3-hydroxymyristoyl] glucosamine N-acyltransferase